MAAFNSKRLVVNESNRIVLILGEGYGMFPIIRKDTRTGRLFYFGRRGGAHFLTKPMVEAVESLRTDYPQAVVPEADAGGA